MDGRYFPKKMASPKTASCYDLNAEMEDRWQSEPSSRPEEPANQKEPTNNDPAAATRIAMRAASQDTSDEIAGPPGTKMEDLYDLHLLRASPQEV